jgi:hypothetical protein
MRDFYNIGKTTLIPVSLSRQSVRVMSICRNVPVKKPLTDPRFFNSNRVFLEVFPAER